MTITNDTPAEISSTRSEETVLEVDDLHVEFRTDRGVIRAVNGVSYRVAKGETVAILGESGSGKSVSAQAIMGILDSPPAFITGGEIRYRGDDLLTMGGSERRRIRGSKLAMVFQDALSALNPVFTVGFQLAEMFRVHQGMSRSDAKERSIDLLDQVGIPLAAQRFNAYPHEFSGGMRQRAMIAMAVSLNPDILIADEPTTALDVTVQAQIMELLGELQTEYGMAMILITHDLGVVAEVADRVNVMYAGRIVERGTTVDALTTPGHPYTIGLMESVPRLDQKGTKLTPIIGAPPDLAALPSGCSFHPRCRFRHSNCFDTIPTETTLPGDDRGASCHYIDEVIEAGKAAANSTEANDEASNNE